MNFKNYDCDTDYEYLFKIVILGDSGVGKTNIISRYAKNEFNIESKATIGVEFHSKLLELDGKIIKLQFWDTAGQERYRSITSAYYRGSNGILVVYDITDLNSFEHINNWIFEIYKNVGNNIPILLVGNKCDLEHKRVISNEKPLQIADKYNLLFTEMSAMANQNVEVGIIKLIQKIYDIHKDKSKLNSNVNNVKITEVKNKKMSCC